MATESSVRNIGGKRSKLFWSLLLVFWVAMGVLSLFRQLWWADVTAACGIINAVLQRRKAPDQPR